MNNLLLIYYYFEQSCTLICSVIISGDFCCCMFTKKDKKGLVLDQNVEFESVDRFCYLGDMISAGGGAELSSRMRVRCAWSKFRELSPILTSRGASLNIKGKKL